RWTEAESKAFRSMTSDMAASLINELTVGDVERGPAWIDDSTILVTSNVDKAILTASTARRFAMRHNQYLFRWKRPLRRELPSEVLRLVYDEDADPELFGYFVAGTPARVLDNTNGNVGWGVANGSSCKYHSLAWGDEDERRQVEELIQRARQIKEDVVDRPFPPDFIIVELLDSALPANKWPPTSNLEETWETSPNGARIRKTNVLIPIGIMKSLNGNRGVLDTPTSVTYTQHAVDLVFVVIVWKAQGCTLNRPSRPHAPKWGFDHLYVGLSRVTPVAQLRCFPLSGAVYKSSLFRLRPNIHTTKWRLENQNATVK
ncbi:hypothetical protein GN958_ATG21940, partial [Phytophthora infestans]